MPAVPGVVLATTPYQVLEPDLWQPAQVSADTAVCPVADSDGVVVTLKPLPVASYTAWDVRVAYTGDFSLGRIGKTWTAALGVNNFTDRMPPASPQAFTDNNADVASYSPIGRLIYASAGIKF